MNDFIPYKQRIQKNENERRIQGYDVAWEENVSSTKEERIEKHAMTSFRIKRDTCLSVLRWEVSKSFAP